MSLVSAVLNARSVSQRQWHSESYCKAQRKQVSNTQASKQHLFINAGLVWGSYIADVGLWQYGLCLQSYLWVLIYRPRKDGQLSWLLACGLHSQRRDSSPRGYTHKIPNTALYPLGHTTMDHIILTFQDKNKLEKSALITSNILMSNTENLFSASPDQSLQTVSGTGVTTP